jgi:ABC-2 type transport system permease protein
MIENESLIFNELDSFKSEVAILIPDGFGEKIAKSLVPQIGIFIDGTNAQIATIVQGYIRAISEFQSLKILSGYFSAPQIKAQPRIWYNPELRSNVFLIPGLIVFILMITCTISTALSIVRERERGTMEQLLISPLSGAHIILGKTLPYVFIALVSLSLVLVTSSLVFNINVKGSYGLLFLSSILFIVCACGQGIFISSVTRSQQVAYFASALSSILPSLILSGFIFPIRNMPYAIQILTYIVPARYFVALLRSIMIKGVHFNIFWKEMLALFLFSLFILLGAIMRMKKAKMT